MIQATQTVPEAQRTCAQCTVQSITKTLQLTLQATMPVRVPAPTAQLSPSAVTQFQGKSQAAYFQERMPPVPQQSPSHVSRPLPQFNPKQPSATQFVTPHTDSVLISQTVTPVANITSTSNVNTLLPVQVASPISQTHPFPATHHRVTVSYNTPIYPQQYQHPPVPQTRYLPQPGTKLFIAAAYGIPRPTLPVFESGTESDTESDFALLKLALDKPLSHHDDISEQYKYQVLLSHLKIDSAQQLTKAYMHNPQPTSTTTTPTQLVIPMPLTHLPYLYNHAIPCWHSKDSRGTECV